MASTLILLDTSDSMNEIDDLLTRATRFDAAKKVLENLISGEYGDAVLPLSVYTFASYGIKTVVGPSSDTREVIDAINRRVRKPSGGTALWNSLDETLDMIPEAEATLVICITDGEDTDSGAGTRERVLAKYRKRKPEVSLEIIMIAEEPRDRGPSHVPVRRVTDVEGMSGEIERILAERGRIPQPMSVAVIPLTSAADIEDVAMVKDSVVKAVQYLEPLTDLQYYPVPTYIVERDTIEQLVGGEPATPLDEKEREALLQTAKALWDFELALHRGMPYTGYEEMKSFVQACRGALSDDLWSELKYRAEGALGGMVLALLNNRDYRRSVDDYLRDLRSLREFVGQDTPMPKAQVMISRELHRILGCLIRRGLQLSDNCSTLLEAERARGRHAGRSACGFHAIIPFPSEDPPEHPVFNSDERSRSRRCFTDRGAWATDDAPAEFMGLLIDVIERLLPRIMTSATPEFIRQARTYGTYYAPPGNRAKLERAIRNAGLPNWFAFPEGGFVLVCIEQLRERVTAHAKQSPSTHPEQLLSWMLLDIAIHEHAHAIVREGQRSHDDMACHPVREPVDRNADEAFAEWCELNYFRDNPLMKEAIEGHAALGAFPEWPYAGATIIETAYASSRNPALLIRRLVSQHRLHISQRMKGGQAALLLKRLHGR